MLYEIDSKLMAHKNCRWFQDEYFDLFVWYTPHQEITGFQLCYDRLHNEHAITWTEQHQWTHCKIDAGEANPLYNQSPILLNEGNFNPQTVILEFAERSQALEPELQNFILGKLNHYPQSF